MKNTKRLVALLIALVMVFAVGATMLIACDPDTPDPNPGLTGGSYDITVWVSEVDGVAKQFEDQIQRFNETNEYGFIFNANIEGVTEAESATKMITDVATGADLYAFAQDQTTRLVQAGALAQLGVQATAEVQSSHDAGAVKAATVGGNVVAYPLTSDNGYFMLYDKSVITDESHLTDLATLVADCEAAGRNFSMEIDTSAWYLASFFFATGCTSEWTYDDNGLPLSVADDFNSPKGLVAAKAIQILTNSKNHVSSSKAADFDATVPSAIVVTGTWDVGTAASILGDNLGMAELPSFTVDGQTYHMGSFSGNKLLGVKPTDDANKAAGLSLLARYLTNAECQLERFESFNWGPSNLAAQSNDAVKADAALSALAAQNAYATPQGNIDGHWWDIGSQLGADIKAATDEAGLQAALDAYKAALQGVIDLDESALKAWSVIGAIGDSGWNLDLEMVEDPENTWISKDAYDITADTAFKLRQGGGWDVQIGANDAFCDGGSGNITLETLGAEAGRYYIKLVLTVDGNGNITGGTVSLVPAE